MLHYLSRAVPLEELAKGDGVSGEDRLFVQRVEDIRRFATEELGLKESKNYTRYVELDRDYLAAVVSASAKDSFTRHEWWFPVVGKVPYKGFFNVEGARKERTKLEKKDLDVWIRGVDAFSTLGWFQDPLYSFMKKYSDRDLADLIIHELLHATVYLKNHSQFNEELAEFVGTEGARLYMNRIRGNQAADEPGSGSIEADTSAEDSRADRAAYLAFIRSLIAELDEVYKSSLPREEKLIRKGEIIEVAKARFNESYDSLFKTENYRKFSELPVNNAYLGLYRLYYEEEHYFKDLYEKSGSNLPNFIAAAKTLSSGKIPEKGSPREELEKALGLR
jgi:predicted aminopeptidase